MEMKRVKGDTTTITMSVVFHEGRPAHRSNQIEEAQYRTCLNHCARCDAWFWPLPTPLPPEAPDPREALIDELAEALREARGILETARGYFPKSIRNRDTFSLLSVEANAIGPAIAHAKAHQEDRQ
jgi:hypothetical protein